jgi:hypothetical protein
MKRFCITIATSMLLFVYGGGFVPGMIQIMSMEGAVVHTPATHDMGHMSDAGSHHCPFMAHGESLCFMSLFDHIGLLRGLFDTLLPTLLLICSIAAICIVWRPAYVTHGLATERRYNLTWLWRRRLATTYTGRQNQDYFAAGLLNPKYF